MRSYEEVEVTKIDKELKSVTCNKCGKQSNVTWDDHDHEFTGHEDMHHADIRFDGERNNYRSKCWEFDLCDNCLVEFVKTFKHVPDWFMGGIGEQKRFEEWIEDGCKPQDRFY